VPIRYALPGLLALLIIIAVGLTSYLSFRTGQASANDVATRLSEEVAQRVEERVFSFLDTPEYFHSINTASVKSDDLNVLDFKQLGRQFWNEVYISKSVPYLYFGDTQGRFIGINTNFGQGEAVYKIQDPSTNMKRVTYKVDANGNPTGDPLATETYDSRTRPWYQAAAQSGKQAWSPIYTFAAAHNLGISAVAPVLDSQGKLQGVLGIDLTLTDLTDFLRQLKPSPNGKAFIIENDGSLVATSTEEDPYKTSTVTVNGQSVEQQNRINAMDSQDPLVVAAAQNLRNSLGAYDKIAFTQDPSSGHALPRAFAFDLNGNRELGEVVRVSDDRGLNWLVVVIIPANDFMAGVYDNIRNTVYFGLVVLVLATILGYGLASQIIKPITRVIRVAAGIEKGRYDLAQLDPVAARTDELGQLARVFHRMADEVHNREQQLQQQVHQLKIEVDEAKRQKEIQEIVDTELFKDLQAKALTLRQNRNRPRPTPEIAPTVE
jgi:methyl-accepting chemotaxis protein